MPKSIKYFYTPDLDLEIFLRSFLTGTGAGAAAAAAAKSCEWGRTYLHVKGYARSKDCVAKLFTQVISIF